MSQVKATVDYSILYESESQVDSSFRRLRLSHHKLKKSLSGAHEKYLRQILDHKRRAQAEEESTGYNKRLKQRKKLIDPLMPIPEPDAVSDSSDHPPKLPEPVEEQLSENEISDSSAEKEGIKQNPGVNDDFVSSPYKVNKSPRLPQVEIRQKKRMLRASTKEVLSVDEDLSQDYAAGKITTAQYHKSLLSRNRLIHFLCLDDLDAENGPGKDIEAVERDRKEAENALQKIAARYPKAQAMLHPRTKVTTSHAYSIAFRPHRETPNRTVYKESETSIQGSPFKGIERSFVSVEHAPRQAYFVTTRPVTAGGHLGGGAAIRTANIKHGGRLSAQNMVNYLTNPQDPVRPKPSNFRSPGPEVRMAVRKAKERLVEERSRSIPRSESIRLQGLFLTAKSYRHSRAVSRSFIDVGLDIPSHLPTPSVSQNSSINEAGFQRAKKVSLRDLLAL